jgi:hypothetical protein
MLRARGSEFLCLSRFLPLTCRTRSALRQRRLNTACLSGRLSLGRACNKPGHAAESGITRSERSGTENVPLGSAVIAPQQHKYIVVGVRPAQLSTTVFRDWLNIASEVTTL